MLKTASASDNALLWKIKQSTGLDDILIDQSTIQNTLRLRPTVSWVDEK
jgi:hypothetical protein